MEQVLFDVSCLAQCHSTWIRVRITLNLSKTQLLLYKSSSPGTCTPTKDEISLHTMHELSLFSCALLGNDSVLPYTHHPPNHNGKESFQRWLDSPPYSEPSPKGNQFLLSKALFVFTILFVLCAKYDFTRPITVYSGIWGAPRPT